MMKPKQNEKILNPGKKITMQGTLRLIAKKIMKTGTLGALRFITKF